MKHLTNTCCSIAFLVCTGLQLALLSFPGFAQYDTYSATSLISEYRQMLVNMDRAIKALDENAALADTLRQKKEELDRESAAIDTLKVALEESGAGHNAEVAQFNIQCLDQPITTQEDGVRCNAWSRTLNERNAELSSHRKEINQRVEDYNARVETYNAEEIARAEEAAELDRSYDEYERNSTVIEGTLARRDETSDITRRCASYNQAETRQKCIQDTFSRESGTRPYTRNQAL